MEPMGRLTFGRAGVWYGGPKHCNFLIPRSPYSSIYILMYMEARVKPRFRPYM